MKPVCYVCITTKYPKLVTMKQKTIIKLLQALIAFLVFAITANANNINDHYYINSETGNDANNGTSLNSPWKSLENLEKTNFKAGDSILFSRNSSFSGGFTIKSSGRSGNPIVFSSYGVGSTPRFTNPSYSILNGNMIQIHGSWAVIDGLCFKDGVTAADSAKNDVIRNIGTVFIAPKASHVTVKNCEAINCPVAVRSFGEFALITLNNFHDCTDKFLCSPNWGPVAVMLMVSNQEVSHNIFEHYYKVGGAWGADGGAIEIDDTNPKKNINIHHNKAYDTQGFIETDGGGPFDSVTVAYNEANVYEKFIGMTKGTNWFVYNNTILRVLKHPGYNDASWFNPGTKSTVWINNIFVLANGIQAFVHGSGAQQEHNHNLFFSVDNSASDPVPGKKGMGDIIGNPKFVNYANRDYHLAPGSPAIGAGKSLGLTFDLDGNPVPANRPPDIGAYQKQK